MTTVPADFSPKRFFPANTCKPIIRAKMVGPTKGIAKYQFLIIESRTPAAFFSFSLKTIIPTISFPMLFPSIESFSKRYRWGIKRPNPRLKNSIIKILFEKNRKTNMSRMTNMSIRPATILLSLGVERSVRSKLVYARSESEGRDAPHFEQFPSPIWNSLPH